MKLVDNIKSTQNIIEGVALPDNEYKKYINGELATKGVKDISSLTKEMQYELVKNVAWKTVKDQKLAKNTEDFSKVKNENPKATEEKFDKVKNETSKTITEPTFDKIKDIKDKKVANTSDNLVENIIKVAKVLGIKLNESAVIQVDMAMELINVIDSSKLPKFITIGDTAYIFKGASSPDLQKLLTAEKGIVGKIIYTQGEGETDSSQPKEIELQIVKTIASRKTVLSVGNIETR